MPLFEIDDLTVSFPTSGRSSESTAAPVVRGLRLEVDRGETVAIVGESGSGKSVSLLAATRLLPGADVTGSVRFDGRDLLGLSERELRRVLGRRIGFVFQDPQSNLHPFKTIGAQIDEVLRVHTRQRKAQRRKRVEELLAEVGIPRPHEAYDGYPAQFSGGMRQRVMIAIAIALNPALIIADEPTTALDVGVQASILALLTRLQDEYGTAIVFVSHDLAVVHSIADTVLVIRDGVVVESGPRERIYTDPQHPYTRDLLDASRLHSLDPDILPDVSPVESRPPLLVVDGLAASYPARRSGRRTVVDDLSFTIAPGEIVGLVGESGSGKSTIGRIVAGLQYADSGAITLAGHRFPTGVRAGIPTLDTAARGAVQLIFQDPYASLNPRRRIRDAIAEPLRTRRVDPTQIDRLVAEAAARAQLSEDLLDRLPAHLSGGQRQRVAIARALVVRPQLIVADEALSALDVTTGREIISLLVASARDADTAILFITHDLGVVAGIAHRVIVLDPDGQAEIGDTRTVFTDPASDYTRRLLAAVPQIEARAS
ncbi:dipeptide ABC transporter ATP-binding protein [Millisia brevis]|uniref:dipeptide ABC transporter ATP-binding protein n=1 Tax=Millisia brevis TaxID=264148 RepID=UPI000830D3B9|nr:ABC transporter ATP-binding protein [Millisia brevis]